MKRQKRDKLIRHNRNSIWWRMKESIKIIFRIIKRFVKRSWRIPLHNHNTKCSGSESTHNPRIDLLTKHVRY